MIRINLLPFREMKAEVGRRRDLTMAGAALGFTVLLIVLIYLFLYYRVSSLESELADLRKDIQILTVKVKEVNDLQNKIKEFRGKNQVLEDLHKKKTGPVRIMESLSAATPTSLWLTEYKETGHSLVLTGMANDNQTVADFLKSLSTSGHFTGVELIETTLDEKSGGKLKKFAIRSGISYQPPPPASVKSEKAPATKAEKKG